MVQGHREVSCCCGFAPLAVGFKKNTITNRHHADNQAPNLYARDRTNSSSSSPSRDQDSAAAGNTSILLLSLRFLLAVCRIVTAPPTASRRGEKEVHTEEERRRGKEPPCTFPLFFSLPQCARRAKKVPTVRGRQRAGTREHEQKLRVCTKEKRAREVGGKGEKALGWRKRNRAAGDV